MVPKVKIKIKDNNDLRIEIDKLADSLNQIDLAKWAIICAKHVLKYSETEFPAEEILEYGFQTSESWQKGDATVHQVRQAGLKIHTVARECKKEVARAAIRSAGHAVGVCHMKEHAMVCSDYAVKTIQLAFPDNLDKITAERQWQLDELIHFQKK
jgi:hypothetical protein